MSFAPTHNLSLPETWLNSPRVHGLPGKSWGKCRGRRHAYIFLFWNGHRYRSK